jgi:hypothetical protein
MGGLGAEALSLSAGGELVLGAVAVTEGMALGAVGPGLGALSIVHMEGNGPGAPGGGGNQTKRPPPVPAREPGRWMYKKPTTRSDGALDYQEQVTGRPAWWVYMIGEVEFDGIRGAELLEAKGPGYCAFFNADGTPKYWYVNSGKFDQLMEQADTQSKLAHQLGVSLTWHVADAKVAQFLRKVFKDKEWNNITVRHTPPAR